MTKLALKEYNSQKFIDSNLIQLPHRFIKKKILKSYYY